MEYHICQQLHSLREVATQNRCVNGGILLRGEGVQLATEVFQAAVHLIGLTVLCALEKTVFGEVCNAELVRKLISASCIYKHSTACHTTLHLAMYATNTVWQVVYVEFRIQNAKFKIKN